MRTFCSLTLLLAVGCGPSIVIDGFKLDQSQYNLDRAQLMKRASFDLNCSEDKLQVKVIDAIGDTNHEQMKQVGVSGCDQRATYVNTFDATGWVMNTHGAKPSASR